MMDYRNTVVIACDSNGDSADIEVGLCPGENGFGVDISALKAELCQVTLRWKADFPRGMRILGDHWERGYGDLEWRGYVPERILPWYCILHDPQRGISYGFGVQVGAGAFASWRADRTGIVLKLDLRNGAGGTRLGGRVLRAADVRCLTSRAGESPFEFSRRFCRLLCPNPRLPRQPVYGGNDWYHTYGKSSAEVILRDASFIRTHSPNRDNPPFMMVDCGWFPARECNGGPYTEGCEAFPDMPGLAAAIRRQEVRPGIWVRPLLTAEAPESWQLPPQHPIQAALKQAVLDPSVPEVLELVRQDIRRFCDWGYELIKYDFSTYDLTGRWGCEMMDGTISAGKWNFADRSRTTAEIVIDLYRAIREAAGETMLMGCNTVGHLGAGLFEIQRTGDDTSGQEWERTRKMGVNSLAFRMPQHQTFYAADADCVGLTRAVPWTLNRQWLELLAASGTPLFVSADPDIFGREQHEAVTAALARAALVQEPGEALDWMETTCPSCWRFGSEFREFDWHGLDGC